MKDEALKLALEVMHDQGDVGVDEWIAAEAAIKQALAAPVQEPVAVTYKEVADTMNALWGGTLKQVQIAMELTNKKLYTTPPAAQPAVPLTDEQIEHLWETRVSQPCPSYPLEKSDWVQFARAIEAAHGITKGQP